MVVQSLRFLLFLSIAFLLFSSTEGLAQQTFNSTRLLQYKTALRGDTSMQNILNFLEKTNQEMPFVEKMQVRTETDELDLNRQEYLFRISFNNHKARKVHDKLVDGNARLYHLKSEILEETRQINRYELIVEWYYAQLELEDYEIEKILLKDRKTVYQKMLSNAVEVDIENLLKVEEDIQELERDALQTELKRDYAIQQLLPGHSAPKEVKLDTSSWISIETMSFVLEKTKTEPNYNLEETLQALRVDYAQLEYDMEKAESNRILDFVQIKYAGRNKISLQKEFSLGVGFNIPSRSTARVDLNEAQLEILDENYRKSLLQAEIEEEIAQHFIAFNAHLREYQLIEQQIEESQMDKLYEKYSASGAIHPLTLLKMKETVLRNQRELQQIEKEACREFLEILSYKGLLSRTPYTNYLSDGLVAF